MTIRRVNISEGQAAGASREAAWADPFLTAPGSRCLTRAAREILIDPDYTTAGLLLGIRTERTDFPRMARPGDVLRFDRPVDSFFVQNMLGPAFAKLSAGGAIEPGIRPNGYLRILSSDAYGMFPPAGAPRRAPSQVAAGYPNTGICHWTLAGSGSGNEAGSDLHPPLIFGAGLTGMRVAVVPLDGDAMPVAPVPADFTADVAIEQVIGTASNGHIDGVPILGIGDLFPDADPYAIPLGDVIPAVTEVLKFSQNAECFDRVLAAGVLSVRFRVTDLAGAGVSGVAVHAEAF